MSEAENGKQPEAPSGNDADRQRSPAYPSIDIEDAIARLTTFYKADKGSAAPLNAIAVHWGTTVKSSGFLQAISSMKRYGLLEELDGKPRRFKPTKLALDIVMLPPADQKRTDAIKRAAKAPKAFAELWAEYGNNLPSDETVQHKLVTERYFRPDAAKDLIRQYKKTIFFANLESGDKIENRRSETLPKVGDLVQWEANGALKFPEPRRITGMSEDGNWAFVEDSQAGLPIGELKLVEATTELSKTMSATITSPEQTITPPPNPNYRPIVGAAKQAVYPGLTGDIVLRYPSEVSADDLEDVEAWLDMLKRQIKKSVKEPEKN